MRCGAVIPGVLVSEASEGSKDERSEVFRWMKGRTSLAVERSRLSDHYLKERSD